MEHDLNAMRRFHIINLEQQLQQLQEQLKAYVSQCEENKFQRLQQTVVHLELDVLDVKAQLIVNAQLVVNDTNVDTKSEQLNH
ncbi:MAG TPA: hypothetical protein VGN34_24910 [Ktedonobacteraceae bacterium]|jgi:hypothetical protein